MTIAEDRRAKFNAEFGRMLGDKIGSTRQNYTDQSMAKAIGDFSPAGKLLKKTAGTSSSTSEVDEAAKEAQLLELAKTGGADEGGISGLLGQIAEYIPDPVKDTVSAGLDIVSRPAYAVSEGIRNVQESINAGEPLWSLGDDLGYGAWKGISGQEKTGWGDVVEEATKYDSDGKSGANQLASWLTEPMTFGRVVNKIEEESGPEGAKWAKRGLGLFGDIATDPTTYLSLGTAKVAKETTKAGARALKAAIREGAAVTGKDAVRETVENSVRAAVKNTPIANTRIRTVVPATGMYGKSVPAIDDVVDTVLKQTDKLFYDVAKGAQAGKMIGGKEAWRTIAQNASEQWRNLRLKELDGKVKRFVDGIEGRKPKLSVKQLDALKKDDVFKHFHETFANSSGDISKAVEAATKASAQLMEKETMEVFARVLNGVDDKIMSIPTLRFMGKDVAYMPRLGRGISSASKRLEGSTADRLMKAFSYTSKFPGYSSLVAQKARALGNADFEKFQLRVFDLAKGTSKADRKLIQKAIEEGIPLTGELAVKKQAVQDMYEELFYREMAQGLRKGASTNMLPDYAYTYLRGSKKSRDEFLKQRKLALSNGTYKQYGTAAASKAGLKPVEDAFQNLLYRKIKSNRQLTRHFFNKDIVSHYGIKGVITHDEAIRRGLVEVPAKEIPDDIAKIIKPTEKMYLDQDIKHILDNYKELSTVGSDAGEEWARQIDYVTRKFKAWNTVYYPGFHIRNFISDMYMGALDGVKTRHYATITKKWMNPNTSTLSVGGRNLPFTKVKELFDENAASGGFLSAELGNKSKHATKGFVDTLKSPTAYAAGVRKFSEHREDFGRFVHFYHALDEEMASALRKTKNVDKALAEATNAATFRVNKYKFDYGALTKMEQKVMRRGMPFYTYMRKAIPTLAEAALMSPKNLSYTNKLYNSLFPEKSDEFDPMTMPDWIKDQMFAAIPGMGSESEPVGVTGTMLPQNVFSDITSNPAAMLNPLLRAPFELNSGKDTFTGRPVEGIEDVVGNNIRLFGTFNKLTDDEVSGAEKAGTILGIPITEVSEDRQAQAVQELRFQIKENIRQLNDEANKHGLKIYLSEGKAGTVIKIRNYDPANPDKSGSVVGEFSSYEEAVNSLKAMYG